MKIVNLIIEILTAPISLIFRTSGRHKNSLTPLAKPIIVFLISFIIVVILVMYFYQDFLFNN